jgi:hypothetical protein
MIVRQVGARTNPGAIPHGVRSIHAAGPPERTDFMAGADVSRFRSGTQPRRVSAESLRDLKRAGLER